MKRTAIVLLLQSLLVTVFAQNDQVFSVGNIEAKRGETVSGSLMVEKGVDEGTFIPVTLINGIYPGPVLALDR